MPMMAVVRLRYSSKDYWFDPAGADIHEGDHVLVTTERGQDMGLVVAEPVDMSADLVPDSLKPIDRLAAEEDFARAEELEEKSRDAMKVFHELADKHGLDMKPTAVHFLFDGKRATFYFTADARVDFRALVRDLASHFHMRVDMRQVGVRDEARMVGGLGHCGEQLCCARLGGELQPVSIRMAKEQDLSLNPTKISGLCGRLMCCLHYEYEAYKDFKQRAPKKNAVIETPAGTGKVVEFDMPHERLTLRMEDGSRLVVPLDAMDTGGKKPREGERLRPCHIGEEAFERINEELRRDKALAMMGGKMFSDNPELADREAKGGSTERNEGTGKPRKRRRKSADAGSSAQGGRRKRRGGGGRGAGDNGGGGRGGDGGGRGGSRESSGEKARDTRKRRRSVSAAKGEKAHREDGGVGAAAAGTRNGSPKKRGQADGAGASKKKGGVRPGQHSSSISGDAAGAGRGAGFGSSSGGGNASGAADGKGASGNGGRRRRRRRRGGSGGSSGSGSGADNRSGGSGGFGSGASTDGVS